MYGRVQGFGFWRVIANLVLSWLLLSLITSAIRTVFVQPFDTPSESMMPTLLPGDDLYVSRYSYGYSRYSLPGSLPLFSGRIFASEPQRGDVVVFRLPTDNSLMFIKRIVGLPGDQVQMINGVLQINGEPIKHERIDDFVGDDGIVVKRYRDTLPNGVSYAVLVISGDRFYDNAPLYTVPAGHYFMIGDNLNNSTDSRVMSMVGFVPFENLIGRAERIYFSVEGASAAAPATIRFDRIGMAVR